MHARTPATHTHTPPLCYSLLDPAVNLDGDVLLKKTFVSGEEVTAFISEVTGGGGSMGGHIGPIWVGTSPFSSEGLQKQHWFICQEEHGSYLRCWDFRHPCHMHAQTLYAGEGQGHPCSSLSTGWGIHSSDAGLNRHWGALHLLSHTIVAVTWWVNWYPDSGLCWYWYLTHSIYTKWYPMIPNDTQWYQMILKWYQMILNDTRLQYCMFMSGSHVV